MFFKKHTLTLVRQNEASECGLACVSMLANYYGHRLDLQSLRLLYPASTRGMSLVRLLEICQSLDLNPRAVRLGLSGIRKLKLPCILHWELNHFVVLQKVSRNYITIFDPAKGILRVSFSEADDNFSGVAIEVSKSNKFVAREGYKKLSVLDMLKNISGIGGSIFNLLGIAVALEFFTLLVPFFFQWVVDNSLSVGDTQILTLLGVSFIFIVCIQFFFSIARGWLVSNVGMLLNSRWLNSLYSHVLNLPLAWHEKRFKGDILSRFESVRIVQSTLTSQFVGSILDGLVSIIAFCILFFYNSKLALIVTACLFLYLVLKAVIFPHLRSANYDTIVNRAKQQQEIVETLTGALPIKLHSKQDIRSIRYRTLVSNTMNSDVAIQRLSIIALSASQFLSSLFRIILIWVGAYEIIDSNMTLGMLIAFLTFSDLFVFRSINLIDKVIEFKMLSMHLDRLGDIVHSEVEHITPMPAFFSMTDYGICCKNISYRYAPHEPWIIENLDFEIKSGECVAIVGPSGSGKTTLAKIILGLFSPSDGEIIIGGIPLHSMTPVHYRSFMTAVMQDDRLFSGSIFENISFFDPDATFDDVQCAAKAAAIHADISKMAMGYHTRVGDMGSSLSGGQVQRVILARALYRKPKVLIMDEATSHLDEGAEKKVNDAIQSLNITRIIIAHRQHTIDSADRVIRIGGADRPS